MVRLSVDVDLNVNLNARVDLDLDLDDPMLCLEKSSSEKATPSSQIVWTEDDLIEKAYTPGS
jgi:hypothetical protein